MTVSQSDRNAAQPKKIEGHEQLWTPANIVTLLRIMCIPIFVLAIIGPWPNWVPNWADAEMWKPWVAAAVFVILSATDILDGYLARSRGEITDLGKFMDPLADKILVTAALLALIDLDVLPSWVAMIIIAREFIVSGIRMVAASKNVVIAASWYGKAKTWFQMIAVLLFIVKDSPLMWSLTPLTQRQIYIFSWCIMVIALILTVLSMLDYFVKSKELLGFKKKYMDDDDEQRETMDETAWVSREELNDLAKRVVESSVERGLTLATAESCTGGLVAARLTNIAGSSNALKGGIVSYSNEAKENELDVDADVLQRHGAVSEQTAAQMCQGAKRNLKADIAVSTTGIAGPGGAVPGKPVGTVCFGVIGADGETHCLTCHFKGDRTQVRRQAVRQALTMLLQETGCVDGGETA